MKLRNHNLCYYGFQDIYFHTDRRTDEHGKIDLASYPDQEQIYFMWSETVPSTCYILSLNTTYPFTLRVTDTTSDDRTFNIQTTKIYFIF